MTARRWTGKSSLSMAGFTMVSAVFIIVVLALLATAITVVVSLQARSSALDVGAAFAYQSARAGLEWGVFQVLRVPPPNAVNPQPARPACFAATNIAMTGQLAGFTSSVSCSLTDVTDGANAFTVYRLTANACNIPNGGVCPNGGTTSATYVERQLVVTVSRCTNNPSC